MIKTNDMGGDLAAILAPSLDAPITEGRSVLWSVVRSPTEVLVGPTFATPFPIDEAIVGRYPRFGIWCDVDDTRREACTRSVVVHRYAAPEDFIIELGIESTRDERLFFARCARKPTLDQVVREITGRVRPSLWRRITGGAASFGRRDIVTVPQVELRAVAEAGTTDAVLLRLRSAGPSLPLGAVTLGRGASYERYFVCHSPFVVLLTAGEELAPSLAAWIDVPAFE